MIALVAVFAIALVSDLLACEWQAARERGQLGKIGLLSGIMEAMAWFPIYVAIFTQSIALVAVSTAGAVIGGVWGAARERKRPPVERPVAFGEHS